MSAKKEPKKNTEKKTQIKKVVEKKVVENKAVIRKRFQGIVVSDDMDKTVVVSVEIVKVHPKYLKRYSQNKKYKVHDEKNIFKVGDKVTFEECRPYSKDKRWRVVYAK